VNRFNNYLIVFVSLAASFLAVFLYLREQGRKEPRLVNFSLTVEVYRIDRHPLPSADIFLNGELIGKTDEMGVFRKTMSLFAGETCLLGVKRESEGFVYGLWETRFKVEEESEAPEKKPTEPVSGSSLEGESDLFSEIERAQSGKASAQDRYHFLALVDGYMFYTMRVSGSFDAPVEGATVVVNGKVEGKTDETGAFIVKYSGEDTRRDTVQVVKTGKHMWMSEEKVEPNSLVEIALDKMLLIDLYVLSESYGVVSGIPNALVFVGDEFSGMTDAEGFFSHAYRNDSGVDGELPLTLRFPPTFVPEALTRTFVVMEGLPKLSVTDFAYSKKAAQPRLAVMPFTPKTKNDLFLERNVNALKTRIEDYLSTDGVFLLVPNDGVKNLFRQFNLDYTREGVSWKDIPPIKKEVDAVVFGEIGGSGNYLSVHIQGVDYSGERFYEVEGRVSLREFLSLSEDIAAGIRANFPVEGSIVRVDKKLAVNLGTLNGVREGNRFNGFVDYYDEAKKGFSKKRVMRLKIVESEETLSVGELESVSEGYFLDAGLKIKRVRETGSGGKEVQLTVSAHYTGDPVPDANVYADDVWIGQTSDDGTLAFAAPANSTIEIFVYKEGYLPGSRTAKVTEGMSPLAVDLRRGESLFTVDSEPEGALVFIDGIFKGTTPLVQPPMAVPFGFHLLEIDLGGYKKVKKYVNFKDPETSFVGNDRIVLFWDYFKIAEQRYANNNIYGAISVLQEIPRGHPDYTRGLELLGYINLNDLKNYAKAIDYYTTVIEIEDTKPETERNLLNRYNAAQAHLLEAENLLYTDGETAKVNLYRAIHYFSYVRDRKNRLAAQDRIALFQDTLFGLAVSYQKLYYVIESGELLQSVSYAWSDYFDFFDSGLMNDEHFKKQHSAAQSYRKEAERLKGER
jgi:hypothetical protein